MIMSEMADLQRLPLFDFNFSSSITLGGWPRRAALHFAAMWLLMSMPVYVVLGFATAASGKNCCRSPGE